MRERRPYTLSWPFFYITRLQISRLILKRSKITTVSFVKTGLIYPSVFCVGSDEYLFWKIVILNLSRTYRIILPSPQIILPHPVGDSDRPTLCFCIFEIRPVPSSCHLLFVFVFLYLLWEGFVGKIFIVCWDYLSLNV